MTRALIALVGLSLFSLNGCRQEVTTASSSASASTDTETTNQLLAFGRAFEAYHLSNKKGPADWDEAMNMGDSATVSALRDKGCLVAWGMRYKDATIGIDQFVLAHLPSALETGGPVLMLSGQVLQAKPEPLKKLLEEQTSIGVPR